MRPLVAASLGLVAGLALGVVLGRSALAPEAGDAPIAVVLEAELERERAAGAALRERIELLEAGAAPARTADEAPALAVAREGGGEADPGGDTIGAGAAVERAASDGGAREGEPSPAEDAGGFQDDRLLELGFHPSDVERIHAAWESLELERLYLQNERARSTTRDGRYWMRMRALEKTTLEDLGESDYDALLYAAGGKNRVRVGSVFDGSPAQEAGFSEGDEILSYGERPVYQTHDVKSETARCELGTQVSVTVLRDGAERRIWTPCGPLGLQLQAVSAPPR